MAAGDLTTLQNLKDWLQVSGKSDDAVLQRLISAASAFIQQWLSRTLALASYTETYDGRGTRRAVLNNFPIVSVSSLVVDGVTIAAAAGPPWSNGYVFDQLSISLYGYCFRAGFGNVQVSYSAGYATVPLDIEQACLELIGIRYKERERIGYRSKSIAGETVSFFVGDMTPSVKTALNPYRKVLLW